MLFDLESYATLFIVPVMCVPVQRLYLKEGQRYDLGASTYISAGAFLAAGWPPGGHDAVAWHVGLILLLSVLLLFSIRVFALAFGRPADFTLISLGQLWATPALIDFEVQGLTRGSGIPVSTVNADVLVLVVGAALLAAILGYCINRTSLPSRLIALTEGPTQYRLLFGSRFALAARLELLNVGIGLSAGVLLRMIVNDLSASTFGNESIWCVLAAAPAARSSGFWALLGPIAATLVRFFVKSVVPARFAAIAIYALLAAVLVLVVVKSPEGSRDATG